MKEKTDITVVTAFFDIGRGEIKKEESKNLKRSPEIYFSYFNFLAELDNDMVIFTEEKYKELNKSNKKVKYSYFMNIFTISNMFYMHSRNQMHFK